MRGNVVSARHEANADVGNEHPLRTGIGLRYSSEPVDWVRVRNERFFERHADPCGWRHRECGAGFSK